MHLAARLLLLEQPHEADDSPGDLVAPLARRVHGAPEQLDEPGLDALLPDLAPPPVLPPRALCIAAGLIALPVSQLGLQQHPTL